MKKLYFINILIVFFLTFFLFAPLIPQAKADWPIFQFNPQHEGTDASETSLTSPLTLEWQVPEVANANIVASGNSIYANTNSGTIYSIDINSGAINWQVQTQNGGEIAFGNNIVYAANGNYIDAYNASTGELLWATPDSYNGISGITYVDGTLYLGSYGSHRLYAVNATTGSRLWEAAMNDSTFAAPAVVNGIVYAGNYQNGMYAFNASNGARIWESNTIAGNYYQSPTIVNNRVYIVLHSGMLHIFDATTGSLVHQRALYEPPLNVGYTDNALAYSDNTFYTAGANGHVLAFDLPTLLPKWNYATGSPDNGTAPIIANGVVYYGNQSTLYGLNKQTGSLIWQYNTGSVKRIINSNHKLLVSSSNGLYAFYSPNQAPTVNQIPSTTINEMQTYIKNGSFTDTGSNFWTATVNYGDGSGTQALTLNPDKTFSLNHQYKDNGTYTVTVKVTDNQGETGTGTATVTVDNIVPTVGAISASVNPIQVNTSTIVSASFTDPGVLDNHTAVWNWGDGNTSNATVTESNGSGSVSDSHVYTQAGVYQISLTLTDKDSGVGTQIFQYLSVYNPTAQGLFSAGQIFTSPVGAYTQNTSITGSIRFGLSYKYQSTVPTGARQFSMDFNMANLYFNATSVDSLVINNGMATLTGAGTLNGSAGYTFLVTGNENTNTIRIQIKDLSGNVIYDTQPDAAATDTPTTIVTGNVLAH